MLAIYLAKELHEKHEKNISIIVYTKALRTFIKHTLTYLNLPEVNVFYQEEINGYINIKHDYIIIDEAQDFSVQDIINFQENAKKGMFIFADENQRLYDKNSKKETTLTVSLLRQKVNFPTVKLKHNYRISKNIAELICNLYPDSSLSCKSFDDGHKPIFIKCNSPLQELEYIKTYVTTNANEDIGILLKENRAIQEGGYFANRNSKKIKIPGVLETKDFLVSSGIVIGYKFDRVDKLVFTESKNINIMTYHSSKGLQFDTVILPFSNTLNSHKNLCVNYVGLTRSKSKLIITYTDIISGEYNMPLDKEKYDGEIRLFDENRDLPIDTLKALHELNNL
ncbi:MAG: ATP-binding domain-containing protein [Bacteroidetes bacterium]|nr:ATP-binding domain-containing protein [Bacteroidota bacterium]